MKIFLNKDVVFKDRLVNLLCEGQLLQIPYGHFTAFIEKASEMVEDINKYKLQALTRNFCITFETCYYTITIEKRSESEYACGTRKTVTWTTWRAVNKETFAVADNKQGNGGIKDAVSKLAFA